MNKKTCEYCNKNFLSLNVVKMENGILGSVCISCRDRHFQYQKKRAGYIYVIGHGEFWKCGHTRVSPETRLKQMQTGNPNELKILKSWLVRDCLLGEKFSQNRLKEFHFRGEWYMATEEKIINTLNYEQ